MQIFATLQPGEKMSAPEIVDGLLYHGYDFGPVAEEPARRVSLTEATLARLVAQDALTEDILGEPRTWHVPVPQARTPVLRFSDLPLKPRAAAGIVFATTFLVTLLGLAILVGLMQGW